MHDKFGERYYQKITKKNNLDSEKKGKYAFKIVYNQCKFKYLPWNSRKIKSRKKEEQQINKSQIDFKFTVLSFQIVPKVRLVKIKKTNFLSTWNGEMLVG